MNGSIWHLSPGTVLRVSHGLYDHLALVSDGIAGVERTVLSFSSRTGLEEVPLSIFAGGRAVLIDGYPGQLDPATVLRRARAMGHKSYSWLWFNCEHFVCHAHGLPEASPQLRQWFAVAAVGSCVLGAVGR